MSKNTIEKDQTEPEKNPSPGESQCSDQSSEGPAVAFFKCCPIAGYDGVEIRRSMNLKDRNGRMIERGRLVRAVSSNEQWICIGDNEFVPIYINTKQVFRKTITNSVDDGTHTVLYGSRDNQQVTPQTRIEGYFQSEDQNIQSLSDLSEISGDEEAKNDYVKKKVESPMGMHMKMIVTLFEHPRKEELNKKNCAQCQKKFKTGFMSGEPLFCYYTGKYYCKRCHWLAKRIIPARVLFLRDIKRYKVCRLAQNYLDAVWTTPSFIVSSINPDLYKVSKALRYVRVLRCQLYHIKAFIMTCRKKTLLLKELEDCLYLVPNSLPVLPNNDDFNVDSARRSLSK